MYDCSLTCFHRVCSLLRFASRMSYLRLRLTSVGHVQLVHRLARDYDNISVIDSGQTLLAFTISPILTLPGINMAPPPLDSRRRR